MDDRELFVLAGFLSRTEERRVIEWLSLLHPIWENRFSHLTPPPTGEWQRMLLRPVYWLGNWQFACLNYYHPPHGVKDRCVKAEPFPDFVQNIVFKIEREIRNRMVAPRLWHLNTLLVNYYGRSLAGGRSKDQASVGEHRDYEPGPVASLSFGESALFQFVESGRKGTRQGVVWQRWLSHGDLQAFGGPWKDRVFHRVQRVKRTGRALFPVKVNDFEVRRINLTFRFVPPNHITDFKRLSPFARQSVMPYIERLSAQSGFYSGILRSHLNLSPPSG